MKRIASIALGVLALFLILFSPDCSKNSVGSGDTETIDNDNVSTKTQGAITVKKYNTDRDTAPDVSSADVSSLAAGNTSFAIDMYKKLAADTGNVFFSPYSISIALAMTWGGARNQTETDMASVLHFPFPQAQLHAAFNDVDLALSQHASASGFELHIVNQLWGEKTYTFLPDYLKLVSVNYGAAMCLLDFIGNPESSRIVINSWVSDRTNQRINDLIPQGCITPSTCLVLTNAIYFKAQWADIFSGSETHDNVFYRSGSDTIATKFMTREGIYTYDSTADYQALEMPYKGEATSMLILLPAPGKMAQVEAGLSAEYLMALYASLQPTSISLHVPKFKFTTGSIHLAEILKSMGMSVAFSRQADFSGIDGTGGLSISDVIHKAFVAVDEKGTEAAAATAVIINRLSMPIQPPIVFSANRPFLFLIRDIQTNAVLFMGKLNDPSKE
jgi:serpin B